MLTLDEAQAILGAVGSDNAPTAEQLTAARAVFVDAARAAKTQGDKLALTAMLEAVKVSDQAIKEATELAAAAAAELDALVQDIPELAAQAEPEAADEPEPAAAAPRMLSVAEAAQRLGLAGSGITVVERDEATPRQTLTINGEDAANASWSTLGNAFAKHSKSQMRGGRTTLASFRTEYDHHLSGRAGDNSRILDELSRRSGEEAVIAAGGCCSLAEPIRDQPMLAALSRPIADSLPTVGATAGAVTFFPPVCLPQGGIATWTCAEDEAVDPEDEATWKQCETIECDEPDTVQLDAIYKCLTIGNFQQRFSPERWDAILHAAAAAQARLAEQTLFNQLANDPNTTQHTVADTGSVYVTLLQSLLRARAIINQNQRYEGRRFVGYAPSWLRDAAELDILARAIKRGRAPEALSVDAALAAGGIDMVWSPDVDPIETSAQTDGPLTQFPETADVVLGVDGGMFRLDGGELNMGTEIRDMANNRQNQVSAFSETFERAVVRSCDTKHITVPVTVCDAAPCIDELVLPDAGGEG